MASKGTNFFESKQKRKLLAIIAIVLVIAELVVILSMVTSGKSGGAMDRSKAGMSADAPTFDGIKVDKSTPATVSQFNHFQSTISYSPVSMLGNAITIATEFINSEELTAEINSVTDAEGNTYEHEEEEIKVHNLYNAMGYIGNYLKDDVFTEYQTTGGEDAFYLLASNTDGNASASIGINTEVLNANYTYSISEAKFRDNEKDISSKICQFVNTNMGTLLTVDDVSRAVNYVCNGLQVGCANSVSFGNSIDADSHIAFQLTATNSNGAVTLEFVASFGDLLSRSSTYMTALKGAGWITDDNSRVAQYLAERDAESQPIVDELPGDGEEVPAVDEGETEPTGEDETAEGNNETENNG